MSTPETEVKTAVTTEKAKLETRVTALEAQAKSWYEKHLPAIGVAVGLVVGVVIGHFVK